MSLHAPARRAARRNRHVLRRCVGLASGMAVMACAAHDAAPPAESRFWLVLRDASCSIDSTAERAYDVAWARLLAAVRPGDRVAVLAVRDGVYTSAVPRVDVVLPPEAGLFESRVRRRRETAALLTRLRNAPLVDRAGCSQTTPLLEAAAAAGRLLERERRERHVVWMSDMVEDADGIDFMRRPPTPEDVPEVVLRWGTGEEQRGWRSARVHVVLAGHVPGQAALATQRFWSAYFRALGADLRSYAGTLTVD